MDTRGKIITREAAVETARALDRNGRRLRVVTGHFDVLQAAHVRELRQVRDGEGSPAALMVALTEPAEPVLSDRARAELVAALDMVDYVVIVTDGSLSEFLDSLQADEIIHREPDDNRHRQRLIQHVHSRHNT